jgi:hypothetical protein
MADIKEDLGIDLYNEVSEMVENRKERQAFLNFETQKLDTIRMVFIRNKNSLNDQLLYIFLSCYARYNNKPWVFVNTSRTNDVTKSYGFTDLVAEKYHGKRIRL